MRGVGGVDAEPGGQHPVIGGRRATALDAAQDGDADLLADALLDLVGQLLGDSGEPLVAELVDSAVAHLHRALGGWRLRRPRR